MKIKGRYTILREIASGGTATVFLAEDSVLRRKVALKKLHPHLHNHPEMVKRFEKEAVAVASLSHGNVIKVYDFGRENHGLFLAMEYVEGISLDCLLQELPGGLPNLAALSVFHQLLEGLAAAHGCGIYHRDIKPSNMLLDRKGCVRIADFGIAFLAEETSITKTGSYLGTPGYSSPEQAMGKAVTAKTDIFATGILFYRALTGKLPFEADTPHAVLMAIMDKHPPKASLVNRRIVPGLPELVQEMLAKDPTLRPDAGECARRIESVASGLGFPLDPARVSRLMAAPERCREKECEEIALRLVRSGRESMEAGRQREAMKLYSLAEVFSDPGSAVQLEAARFLSDRLAIVRRRKAALISLAVLFAGGGGILAFRFLGSMGSAPGLAMVVKRPAPALGAIAPPAVASVQAVRPAEPASSLSGRVPSPGGSMPGPAPAATLRRNPAASGGSGAAAPLPPGKTPGRAASREAPAAVTVAVASDPPKATAAAAGLLWIKTNPPFAKIYVDGKEMGSTPLSAPIQVPAGRHRLELERAGCITISTEFTMGGGDTASLRFTLSRIEEAP